MVTTPPDTPVTIPLTEPTVAIDVLLLLHVPPATESVNANVAPAHTEQPVDGQEMTLGTGLTTTGALPVIVAEHDVEVKVATTV
jgi:hypothetical protein